MRFNLISINEPGYSLDVVKHRFWADINSDFGTWHEKFSKFHLKKSCINVDFEANSYGARDVERNKDSINPRILFLGDSFVEGYGVDVEKRLTNLLESETKIEHLNFGTSGGFGPTQYYLLYRTLAKQFSHEAVVVTILPFNDFFDDDLEFGKKAYPNRYRPYFEGEYPNYRLIYFNQKKKIHSLDTLNGFEKVENIIRGFLAGYTYSYNAITRLKDVLQLKWVMKKQKVISGYYQYTPEQYNRLRYVIEKIQEEAKSKKVIVLTIPVLADLQNYALNKEPPLSRQLSELAKKNGFLYIDLLPPMHDFTDSWQQYFLTCDGHWSNFGNEVAAKILKEKISYAPLSLKKVDRLKSRYPP